MRTSFHLHVIHDERLIVRSLLLPRSVFLSVSLRRFTSSLPHSTCTLTCTSSMWTAPKETPAAPSPIEEYCSLAFYQPPTGYEPNVLDDFHYSETKKIFEEESGDKEMEPSYLCDAELDDVTIGRALTSPLFVHSVARRTSGPKTSLSLS